MPESITTADLIVPAIILAGAGLISSVMMLVAIAQWMRVASARRWPVVPGTVLESQVVKSRNSHGAWSCRPVVTYRYQVAAQIYQNDLLAFGARSLSQGGAAAEKRAQETVARYPVACQVEVHHHPDDPAQSVLEIRSAVSKWLVIAGIIFLCTGTFAAAVVLIVKVAS